METHNCSILPQPLPQFCPWPTLPRPPPPTTFASPPSQTHHPKPISHQRLSCSTKFRSWDSNAESVGSRKFSSNFRNKNENPKEEGESEDYAKKRRWWSDESPPMEEGTSGGLWDEATDYRLWIFEIFKSYGWTLPFILLSGFLVNDPNAFLVALALPLCQSALSLAFEKLFRIPDSKPKRKVKMRRKPFARTASTTIAEEEELEENQKTRKGNTGYQSWVVENGGSLDGESHDAHSFGGWDDLEGYGPATRSSQRMDSSQRITTEEGKLSRRERKSDTPLLLRLLIAIFPFLGTWTKIL